MKESGTILTGKCEKCVKKADKGGISMECLGCKRQYYPNMESEPYERKPDKYTEVRIRK